ncbi:hypothetical protein BJ170DRAFT_688259 [Xylariales sp. AK1849]|nr:hypothetical protein BJ170DRAFT_688259 [Xylariales sp. AK1849]
MDLGTVSGLVTALVSTYNGGLEYYTKWQRRKWQENNYAAHVKAKLSHGGCCGLSTSLSFSAFQIRSAFDSGADLLGDGFSVGDEQCRRALHANLELLHARVDVLQGAMKSGSGPLELFEMIRTSEAVRISTLRALDEHYHRTSVGSPPPRERASAPNISEAITPVAGLAEDELQSTYRTASPAKSVFRSEPLSPPPTPTGTIPDDLQPTCTTTSGGIEVPG